MIFSVIIILLVGLVAYFHYIQGLLSGLISAVLAILCATLALSFYEPMADGMSGGKYSDYAHAICLIAIFALSYLILRILFDKLIPGNVRLPHIMDSVGGAICGLVAGIFGIGIVVIAAQSLPFGPSIAGYTRYPLNPEKSVSLSARPGERGIDRMVIDELKNDDLVKEPESLLLPVDDIVLGTVKHLSNGGSLAGQAPFESVHPDLSQEYFGQRLGIQLGGKRTASNKNNTQVEFPQVNVLPGPLPKAMAEFKEIRPFDPKGTVAASPGNRLITVAVLFKKDASDTDNIVRLSPGAVRIVAKDSATDGWKNVFPIGTVQNNAAWLSKPDDYIFVDTSKDNEGQGVYFLFEVPADMVTEKPTPKLAEGSFIEVKRLVKQDLSELKTVVGLPPAHPRFYPLRKEALLKGAPAAPAPTETPATPTDTPATPAPNPPTPAAGGDNGFNTSPLGNPKLAASTKLPIAINVDTSDKDAIVATTAVQGELKNRKFDTLDIDPADRGASLANISKGADLVSELFVPDGKRMVQVNLTTRGSQWASSLGDYTVVDSAGASHRPSGAYATIGSGALGKFVASYKSAGEVTQLKPSTGNPADVTLIYLLPADAKAMELQYQGKPGGPTLEQ